MSIQRLKLSNKIGGYIDSIQTLRVQSGINQICAAESLVLLQEESNLAFVLNSEGKTILGFFQDGASKKCVAGKLKKLYPKTFNEKEYLIFVDDLIEKGILISA